MHTVHLELDEEEGTVQLLAPHLRWNSLIYFRAASRMTCDRDGGLPNATVMFAIPFDLRSVTAIVLSDSWTVLLVQREDFLAVCFKAAFLTNVSLCFLFSEKK